MLQLSHLIQVTNEPLGMFVAEKHVSVQSLNKHSMISPYVRSVMTDATYAVSTKRTPLLLCKLLDLVGGNGAQPKAQCRNLHARGSEAITEASPGVNSNQPEDGEEQNQAHANARQWNSGEYH